MFEETPKLDFTVTIDGVTVYRSAIEFETMAELRSTSQAEREAMYQARYDQHLADIEAMTAAANTQQEETETPEVG